MQQSKAYVIKNANSNLKATMAARKAEYAAYRYGGSRKVALPHYTNAQATRKGGR